MLEFSQAQGTCSIQDLIDHWHDETSLRRALCNPGLGLVLSIHHSEIVQHQQPVCITHCASCFYMPYFTQDGLPAAQECISCALTFHEGQVAQQGHYRSALRTSRTWMI